MGGKISKHWRREAVLFSSQQIYNNSILASWLFSRDQMDYWQTNNRFQLIHNKNLLKWLTVTTGPMLGAGYIFWEKMVFLTNVPVTLSDLDCVMCQHYPPANSLLLDCNSGKCQLGVMWTFQVLIFRTAGQIEYFHFSANVEILVKEQRTAGHK